MIDLKLIETGNGGDLIYLGKDLVRYEGWENMVYMALFGGDEFWGNIFLDDDAAQTFKCETGKLLENITLNSAGRLKIEQAVSRDLAFIAKQVPGTTVSVSVTIISDNRVDIDVKINGEEFQFNWNPEGVTGTVQIAPTIQVPKYWYKTEGITVSEWAEFNGTGVDMGSSDPSMTTFPAVATAAINGYDALSFTGVSGKNAYTANDIELSANNKATLIMVAKFTSIGGDRVFSISETSTDFFTLTDAFGTIGITGGIVSASTAGTGMGYKGITVNVDTAYRVYEFAYDRTIIPKVYIDGTLQSGTPIDSGTPLGNFGDHKLFLGHPTSNMTAEIAEVMIFDNLLSSYDRTQITNDLKTKFNLP